MRAVGVLTFAFTGVNLAAALSFTPSTPPRRGASQGHRHGISILEVQDVPAAKHSWVAGASEMVTIPSGSVLGAVGGHILAFAGLKKDEPLYVGEPPPKHSIVISRSQYWILVASYVALWSIAVFFTGWLYMRQKAWPPVDPTGVEVAGADLKRFSSSPFGCMEDFSICFWAFVCPCIRWADNVSTLNLMGFWSALAMMGMMEVAYSLTGYVTLMALSALVWTHFRQRMRQMFDMEGQNECSYYAFDCLLYFACMPCAIAQEARHLELAARSNHEAVKGQRPVDA